MPGVRSGLNIYAPTQGGGGGGQEVTGSSAYQDLYDRLIGSRNGTAIGQVGGPTAGTWQDRRQQYMNEGGGFVQSRLDAERERQSGDWWTNRLIMDPTRNQQDPNATYHKAEGPEAFLAGIQSLGKRLMDVTGFSHNRQTYGALDPRTLTSFVASLPFQTIGGAAEAPAQIYEWGTGQNLTENYQADDQTFQVKNQELNQAQRNAQLVNGALNAGAPFLNGAGDFLVATGTKALGAASRAGKAASKFGDELTDTNAAAARETIRKGGDAAGAAVDESRSGFHPIEAFDKFADRHPALRNALDTLPTGAIGRRASRKRAEADTMVSPGKMIISDAVGEGVEEAVQSVAEDIRYDELDGGTAGRALESALWGAAGGGIMGGAAYGLQSTMKATGEKVSELRNGTKDDASNRSSRVADFLSPRLGQKRDQFASAFQERMNKKASEGNEQVGAISVKSGTSYRPQRVFTIEGETWSTSPGLNTAAYGVDALYDFYHARPGNREVLANTFGLDAKEIDEMFAEYTEDKAAKQKTKDRLNLQLHRNPVYIAYGRNPRTPHYGTVMLRLDEITDGNTISVDPLVHEIFCDDVDGDMAVTALSGELFESARKNGMPSRQLSRRDRATTNAGYDYASFTNDDAKIDAALDRFANIFNFSDSQRSQLKTQYKKSLDPKADRSQEITNFFDMASDMADDTEFGKQAVDDSIHQLFAMLKNPVYDLEEEVASVIKNANERASEAEETIISETSPQPIEGGERGKAPDMSRQRLNVQATHHVAQWVEALGIPTGFVEAEKGNAPFREQASLVLDTNAVRQASLEGLFDPSTPLTRIIATMLKMRNTGVAPETVISMIASAQIHSETMEAYLKETTSVDGLIHNDKDWEVFSECYTNAVNHVRKEMIEACNDETIQGPELNLGAAIPAEIEKIDGKPSKAAVARSFVGTYQDTNISSLFFLSSENKFARFTLYDVLKYADIDHTAIHAFDNTALSSIFVELLNNYNTRAHAAEVALMREQEELFDKVIEELREHLHKNAKSENSVDISYETLYALVHEYFCCLFNPEVFDNLQVVGARRGFLDTDIGFKLVSAESVDVMYNAEFRIAMVSQYLNDIQLMDAINRTRNNSRKRQYAEQIIHDLASMQARSPLHTIIYREALKQYDAKNYDKLLTFLDKMVDTSVSWSRKRTIVTELEYGARYTDRGMEESPILIYALAGGSTELDIGNFAVRRKRASGSMKNAQAFAQAQCEQNAKDLADYFNDSTAEDQELIIEALRFMAMQESNKMPRVAFTTFIADMFDVARGNAEKGTVVDSQTFLHECVEYIKYGDHESFMSGLTNASTGQMNLSDFIANPQAIASIIFDPDKKLRIVDDIHGGRERDIDQRGVFVEFGIIPEDSNVEITSRDYIRLFQEQPRLLSQMTTTALSITTINSEARITPRQTQTPLEAVKEYVVASHGDRGAVHGVAYRTHYAAVENYLIDQPKFYGFVCHLIEDFDRLSGPELEAAIGKAWDAAVQFIFDLTSTDPDSDQLVTLKAIVHDNMYMGLMDQMQEMLEDQEILRDSILNNQFDYESCKGGMKIALENMNDFIAEAYFRNKYADIDLDSASESLGYDLRTTEEDFRREAAFQEEIRLIYMAFSYDPRAIDTTPFAISEKLASEIAERINTIQNPRKREQAQRDLEELRNGGKLSYTIWFANETQDEPLTFPTVAKDIPLMSDAGLNFVSPFVLTNLQMRLERLSLYRMSTGRERSDLDAYANRLKSEMRNAMDDIVAYVNDVYSSADAEEFLKAPIRARYETLDSLFDRLLDTSENAEDTEVVVNEIIDFATTFNMLIVDYCMRRSKGGTQAPINEQGGSEMIHYLSAIDSFVEEARQVREELSERRGGEEYLYDQRSLEDRRVEIPKANFTSSALAYAAQNAISNAGSAGAASVVSQNGIETGSLGMIGLIDPARNCSTPPVEMTFGELKAAMREDPDSYLNVAFYEQGITDAEHRHIATALVSELKLSDDTPVTVYRRDFCGGACNNHSHQSDSERVPGENSFAHTVSTVLSNMLKYAKEGLSLRLKKNLSNAVQVVDRVQYNPDLDVNNEDNIGTFVLSDPDWRAKLADFIGDYRMRFAEHIYNETNSRGFQDVGLYDCIDLANTLCATVQMTYEDNTGEVHNEIVSLDWLINDVHDTGSVYADSLGNRPVVIRPHPVSVKTLAGHIADRVNDWSYQRHGKTPTQDDLYQIADDAFDDWTDWKINDSKEFTIRDVMASANILTAGVNENLRLAISPSRAQRFNSAIHPEVQNLTVMQSHNKNMSKEYGEVVDRVNGLNEANSPVVIRTYTGNGQYEDEPVTRRGEAITAVFTDKTFKERTRGESWPSRLEELANITRFDSTEDSNGDGSFVLVTSEKQSKTALRYALNHHKRLAAPAEVVDDLLASNPGYDSMRTDNAIVVDGQVFRILDTYQLIAQDTAAYNQMQYEVEQCPIDRIFWGIGDPNNEFGLADSDMIISADAAQRADMYDSDDVEIPTAMLFDERARGAKTQLINDNDLKAINNDPKNSNIDLRYWTGQLTLFGEGKEGEQQARNAIARYLQDAKKYNGYGKFKERKVHPGDCIGFVKRQVPSGKKDELKTIYAPIFVAKSVPRTVRYLNVKMNSKGYLTYNYNQRVQMRVGDTRKVTLRHQASKFLATIVDKLLPTMATKYDGPYSNVRFSYARDAQSDANRDFGQGPTNIASNFFYDQLSQGMSLFHVKRKDGPGVEENQALKRYLEVEQGLTGIFDRLIAGDREAWGLIAQHEARLAPIEDEEMNSIYADVAARCLIAGLDPCMFFCPIKVKQDGTFKIIPLHTNVTGIFSGMNFNEVLRFFHHTAISCGYTGRYDDSQGDYSYYCPDGTRDRKWWGVGEEEHQKWRFNMRGCVYQVINGNGNWYTVEIGPVNFTGETTAISSVKGAASYSYEQRVMDLMDLHVLPDDGVYGDMLAYLSQKQGYIGNFRSGADDFQIHDIESDPYGLSYVNDSSAELFSGGELYYLAREYQRSCERDGRKTLRNVLPFINGEGSRDLSDADKNMIKSKIDDLNEALGMEGVGLNHIECRVLYQLLIGYSSTTHGDVEGIYVTRFCEAMDMMIDNLSKPKALLIEAGILPSSMKQGPERVPIPLIERHLAEKIFKHSKVLKSKHRDFKSFQEAMLNELAEAEETIDTDIHTIGKKYSLFRLADYLRLSYRLPIPLQHLFGERSALDQAEYMRFYRLLSDSDPDLGDDFYDKMKNLRTQMRERQNRFDRMQAKMRTGDASETATRSGSLRIKTSPGFMNLPIWNKLAQLSKTMGLANFYIGPANFLGRMVNGGIMNFMLKHNSKGPGHFVYEPGIEFTSPDIVKTIAHDEDVVDYFKAMKAASYSGKIQEFQQISNREELRDFITRENAKPDGKFAQMFKIASDAVMKWAAFGEAGITLQIEVFLNRFAQLCGNDTSGLNELYGHEVTIDGRTYSQLEVQLTENSLETIIELVNGPAGQLSAQAWNFAQQGDQAQRNIVSELVGHICGKYGLVNFLTTTFVSRYFTYATNIAGRILSAVAPISSIHYLAVDFLSKQKTFEDWNLQDIQTRQSLKEAVHADMLHMGATLTGMTIAAIVACMGGILQPPDDEKKAINPEEWFFFGFPIKEAWWIQDILGPALPIACAGACVFVDNGKYAKYAISTLINGLTRCAFNNPLFSISDLVDGCIGDVQAIATGDVGTASNWSDAPGGEPTALEMISDNAMAGTLSWASQFITPSFVKDLVQAFQQYEVSYKKTTKHDAAGNLVTEVDPNTGQLPLEDVSYWDSQIRMVTRNNPILGFLVDVFTGRLGKSDGYLIWEMPLTEYYEPLQVYCSQQYSMFNEDGSEKSDVEKQAIALEIIDTLNTSDDMEELYRTGFYIPYETKKYVGAVIWDTIQQLQDNYNAAQINGDLDKYAYGDWATGNEIVESLKAMYWKDRNDLMDLYENKLWSEPMRRRMVVYNRINSTYAQDYDGNWYSTGYPRSILSVLPFTTRKGDLSNPGSTMGAEGDFASQSAIDDSITTGQRGLVLADSGYEPKIDIEEYAGDGNDNGKSGYPTGTTTNPSYGKGWGSGYGYRSYYRRSGGGGGGGGYTPSIRSYSPSFNISSPATMQTSRYYGPNFDYLRPAFETKGSREASKREDF